MNCLGIDQSLRSTGLCLTDKNGNMLDYRLIQIDENKDQDYQWLKDIEDETIRKIELCNLISERIVDYMHSKEAQNIDIGRVNIEGLAFGIRGDATRTLGGLQFMVINDMRKQVDNHTFCAKKDGIGIIPPTSLKKFATGAGNSKKEALYESLPNDVQSHFEKVGKTKGRFDLVDAYWLSLYGVNGYEAR